MYSQMEDWIVVLDENDKLSQDQLNVCKAVKPTLKGVVMCNQNTNIDMCNQVDYFPAFCHTSTNSCVYGLRKTEDEFVELTKLVPPKRTESQPQHPQEKAATSI